MRDHTKLKAFELSDELVIMIYRITQKFPKEEIYGLTSQMRRAAVSVPTNIVEGCARSTQIEYHRFLVISYGSLKEVDYLFNVSSRLEFITESDFSKKCKAKLTETIKVLAALLKSME